MVIEVDDSIGEALDMVRGYISRNEAEVDMEEAVAFVLARFLFSEKADLEAKIQTAEAKVKVNIVRADMGDDVEGSRQRADAHFERRSRFIERIIEIHEIIEHRYGDSEMSEA